MIKLHTLNYIDITELDKEVNIDPGEFDNVNFEEYQRVLVKQTFTYKENGSYFSFNFQRASEESTLLKVKNYYQKCNEITKQFQDNYGNLNIYFHW